MLIAKIGYYNLNFALLFSILIFLFLIIEKKNKNFKISKNIYLFSFFQLLTVTISFSCLILSFIISDFSLVSVYENSHTQKPLFYKISGVWGNHEGSLLLWIIVLILFSFLFLITSDKTPKKYRLDTIFFQNLIIIGFLLFALLTSNAFEELFPIPAQGLGLNPILQDPILAIHPPTLYAGYVGSSIFFSSGLSAMINNYVNKNWAQSIKYWIFISWIFLTLGILLGSIWAYYELGWGGFWFWDPVENASLMPWLASTALLHSIIILEKRETFQSWTIILAIITFTLSMTGTFLVRSGILNSVHTFANDPSRGLYILIFLSLLSLIALIIFFFYQNNSHSKKNFTFLSKETAILINNWFMVFFLATVLIGTIYPIFLDVLTGEKISIGPPFYNFIIIPFIIPFLIFMAFGPKLNWIDTKFEKIKKNIINLIIISFLVSVVVLFLIFNKNMQWISFLILFSSFILIFSVVKEIINFFSNKLYKKNPKKIGRLISHLGFGFLILSIFLNANLSKEVNANLKVSEKLVMSKYTLIFNSLTNKKGPNYNSIVGNFVIQNKNRKNILMNSEIRIYEQPQMITSEATIKSGFFSDLYLTMSYLGSTDYLNIRFQQKPFMNWIWFSVILIAIGGIPSFFIKKI